MRMQTTKSISFFMELMIVICFFTLSASICVLVMSNAYDKSKEADDIKKALLYGQNIIEQKCDYLRKESFQMDEHGNIVEEGIYQVDINVVRQEGNHAIANLHITKDGKELSVLSFHQGEDLTHVCE